jgi:hypothetical protein
MTLDEASAVIKEWCRLNNMKNTDLVSGKVYYHDGVLAAIAKLPVKAAQRLIAKEYTREDDIEDESLNLRKGW